MKVVRTIKDLADLAGVTSGTVSRALAGSDLVKPKTREHIVRLAREHGFTPNATARNLRTRRTGAIGVLIPLGHEVTQHVSDPFFITMLGLLADQLTDRRYNLLLSRVVPTDQDWLRHFTQAGQVDGVIVIGQSDQARVLDEVAQSYRPMVVWGAHRDGQHYATVGSDNRMGGYIAARHLIERGCRRIAFVGDPGAIELGDRLTGCREAARDSGVVDALDIVPTHLVDEIAHPEIATYLAAGAQRPDGLVAASDVIAMSALRAIAEAGLSCPHDIKVIGYDGLPIGDHTIPRLTSVAQNLDEGASHLVDIVLRRIAGEDAGSKVMTPRLRVRMST